MDHHPGRTRPRRVTLFSVLVLLLGSGLNLIRAVWAMNQANALSDVSVSTSLPMTWLAGTSLVWGFAFFICSVGLWRMRRWGRVGTLAVVTLFHTNIWINHILFDRSDYARQAWPFALVHSLVALVSVWGFLSWPSIRNAYSQHGTATAVGEDE